MKKTLFLHIGMGKTGTTALQNFFWFNRRELRRLGISYPKFGMMAHAHHLLSPYRPPELRDKWEFRTVAEWGPRLQKAVTDKILLSSELIAWASGAEVTEFCRSVACLFDLKVIIYLRRQDNIIMANYNQLVKAGSQQNDLEWILENELAQFDYLGIIEPWARSIGKENIIVRPYEKQQFYQADICQDFMHHVFGVDVSADFRLSKSDPNPRFSYAALEYKLQLNRLIEEPGRSSRFNKVLLKYSGEPASSSGVAGASYSLLSPTERMAILQRSRPVNEEIARDYMQRDDGVLFDESIGDTAESWVKPQLASTQASSITRYIQANDSRAYRRLVAAVRRGNSSLRPRRTEAVKFFRQCLPAESLAKARREKSKSGKPRPAQKPVVRDDKLLLVSVHFPVVAVDGYEALLQRYFGRELVRDYQDRPLSLSGPGRVLDALEKGIGFAREGAPLRRDTCVHGHFMPLKFLLPSRGHRKRFVTWMSDPVERLMSHYALWKGSVNRGPRGGLHHRMIEEDWSLDTFCFLPEMKNLYSKYLRGFPLSRFDFVGIADHRATELQRFSLQILGNPLEDEWLELDSPASKAVINADLRARIERYHSADMALYRRALKLREKTLAALSRVRQGQLR